MDVYRPAGKSAASAALIFYTLYWPTEGKSARESSDWYKSWARIAAANGIVAILPDLRAEPGTGNAQSPARALGDDFQRLLAYVAEHAADYGVDPERMAVYAASGATWSALPVIQDARQTHVRAAVLYYGSASVEAFRSDIPLLWVRAGLDSQQTNADIVARASVAIAQNAPVVLINHPTGQHGFEGRTDDAITRQVMEQTLAFVKRTTTPEFRRALKQRTGGRTP